MNNQGGFDATFTSIYVDICHNYVPATLAIDTTDTDSNIKPLLDMENSDGASQWRESEVLDLV